MSDKTAMTFYNPVPPDAGQLIYTIVDATGASLSLDVPYLGSVQHPTWQAGGPWQVSATLGTLPTPAPAAVSPAVLFSDPNAAVTLQLTPVTAPLAPPVAEPAANVLLPYINQYQHQTNWCWAAVTAGVAAYYTGTTAVTQEALADHFFPDHHCAIDGSQPFCNRPFYVDASLAYVDCLQGQPVAQGVDWPTVCAQLADLKPLAIGVAPADGATGHALCIVGYDDNSQAPDPMPTVDVADPWRGWWRVPFADFPNCLYTGYHWTLTCLTRAPSAQ